MARGIEVAVPIEVGGVDPLRASRAERRAAQRLSSADSSALTNSRIRSGELDVPDRLGIPLYDLLQFHAKNVPANAETCQMVGFDEANPAPSDGC